MAAQVAQAPLPQVPAGMDLNALLSNSMNAYTPAAAAAAAAGGAPPPPPSPAAPVGQSGTAPGAVSPVGTGPGGVYQPSAALAGAPPLSQQSTAPALMNPGDPAYQAWLNQQLGRYAPATA